MQYIADLDGMVVVTNPSSVSQIVAKRAIIMAIEGGVEVLGVIENMSGYVCPKCSKVCYPMLHGGGEKLAKELEVPFLGRVPLDPSISSSSDIGAPVVYSHPDSVVAGVITGIADEIEQKVSGAKS
jgi:Mrp family chromosome partitioning ATPase